MIAESLPVNYAVLTALPINQTNTNASGGTQKDNNLQYCDVHKNKKVKFFCKSDQEMFCSKCVLKHTNAKHEVITCSYKSNTYLCLVNPTIVIEMKRLVKEMLDEVEVIDKNNTV